MVSAQDKLMAVASRLGLDTLQYMQGSTGAIYDADTDGNGIIFGNANRHNFPSVTNLNDNRFEVNEALLVETVGFYTLTQLETGQYIIGNLSNVLGQDNIVLFDLVIGNKTVMKDTPVWSAGSPFTFASAGLTVESLAPGVRGTFVPRHQVYLEGAGIVIPPQVDFQVNYKVYNTVTGAVVTPLADIGVYLFGTKVNLNFNTSL